MILGRWRRFAARCAALTRSVGKSAALTSVLALSASALAHAQGTVTGKVTGQAGGQPIADARILLIGTNLSAVSGEDGSYTIRNVPAGPAQVQALRVGFKSERKTVAVTAGASATADFQLSIAVAQLDEVVTTATGQQRRVELGNAVSTLGDVGKRVEQTEIHTIGDLMVAKAPGVIVLPAVMTGGAPTVRIRGLSSISLSNAPIWIVDGVRFESGTVSLNSQTSFSMLNSLNPDEIEDIEIVKGPSAATLYGTAAANGVVVVTTKKGRAGKARWNWIAERGSVQDRNEYQTMYANWGHAPGKTTPIRCKLPTMVTAGNPTGICISDSLTSYNLMKDPDRTFVKDQPRSLYGVNVAGGSEAVRYFVSGEVDEEIGPIEMPKYEIARFNAQGIDVRKEWLHPEYAARMNFRGNLSAALSPTFDVNVNTGFARNENRLPPSGSAFEALYYVGMQNYGYKGCPGGVAPCGLDKNPIASDTVPLNEYFQYAPGDVMQRYRPQLLQRTLMSLNANWRPRSWLVSDATIGFDLANRDNSDLCRKGECAPSSSVIRAGQVSDAKRNDRTVSAKLSSTGSWTARSWLNLKTTVGGDYTNVEFDATNSSGITLPPGGSTVDQAATRSGGATWPTATKTLGFYAQQQAELRDRLFLTVAARTDQNSAFGTKFQRVVYPKASVSWLASDESFFPRIPFMNSFRLRSAYGASGVQPGRTDALVTFAAGSQSLPSRAAGSTSGVDTPGLAADQPGNAELRPEKSTEIEAGFETQLFNNRIRVDYTTYNKKTKDALIRVDIAPSSAAAQLQPLINVGSTQNTGHELLLNAQLVDSRHFSWDVTLTGSHESNKVLDLGIDPVTGKGRIINPGGSSRQLADYPINSRWFRGYQYSDANKDGILQLNEVQVDTAFSYYGYAFPRDLFSIQNGIDLFEKKLHLSALFDYKGGFTLQDGGNNFQCSTGPFACREIEDPTSPLAWQARNIARVNGSVTAGTRFTTTAGYLQNGQFWKFREFSAAYQLPTVARRWLRSQGGSSVVFAVRNLHTWSNYTGLDPEEHDAPSDTQSNFQSAPPPRYLILRLNLKY